MMNEGRPTVHPKTILLPILSTNPAFNLPVVGEDLPSPVGRD